jgi:hypothetical protein
MPGCAQAQGRLTARPQSAGAIRQSARRHPAFSAQSFCFHPFFHRRLFVTHPFRFAHALLEHGQGAGRGPDFIAPIAARSRQRCIAASI